MTVQKPPKLCPSTLHGAPPVSVAPDQLGVEHDAVGAEVGQVVGLGLGRAEPGQGLPGGGGGPAGAALVEQQHPVVLQRPVQPALPA